MGFGHFFDASQQISSNELVSAFAEVNQYLQLPQVPKFHNLEQTQGDILGGISMGRKNSVFGSGILNNMQTEANSQARNANIGSNNVSHCLLPFLSLDMGHMLHYADFLPPEASYPLVQRQRQYHMAQYHMGVDQYPQAFPTGTHGKFDANTWASGNEQIPANKVWNGALPSGFYIPNPNSMDMHGPETYNGSWPSQPPSKELEVKPIEPTEIVAPSESRKKSLRVKQTMGCLLKPQISVDYSDRSLDLLVDLKPNAFTSTNTVMSSTGAPVNFLLRGFLNGRLLSNDQDNYNYIQLSAGSVDPSQVYHPQVISCYRRNFINLHLHLQVDAPAPEMVINGQRILRIRLEINAITDKENPEPVALLNNEQESDLKDPRRSAEMSQVEMIGPSHAVELADCKHDSFWKVKKLQFKSATANSTNLVFQTYYRFVVRLLAETSGGDFVLQELVSNPIIVRGRNPSFYQTKNDVLIKAKSPNLPSSYDYSTCAIPLLSADHTEQEQTSTSDMPTSLVTDESVDLKNEDASPGAPIKAEESFSEKEVAISEAGSENVSDAEPDSTENQKQKDDSRSSLVPNGADIQKILDSMGDQKGNKYRYFPILSVYYLPPINVVYFPHGAHHTDTASEPPEGEFKDPPNIEARTSQAGSARKASSKVYFR